MVYVKNKIFHKIDLGGRSIVKYHLTGYIAMYLSKVGDNYYAVHSGAGYRLKNKDGSIRLVSIHGVFVMEVHQFLMSGKKSYLRHSQLLASFSNIINFWNGNC